MFTRAKVGIFKTCLLEAFVVSTVVPTILNKICKLHVDPKTCKRSTMLTSKQHLTLSSLLTSVASIGYKCVFKTKYSAYGTFRCQKARLIVKGFH